MLPFIIFLVFVLLTDLYAFKGLKNVWGKLKSRSLKVALSVIFWLIPFILLGSMVTLLYFRSVDRDPAIFNAYMYITGFAVLFYLPKLVFILFHMVEDIIYLVSKLIKRLRKGKHNNNMNNIPSRGEQIFLSKMGLAVCIIPFFAILYGILIERFNFQVINETVVHESLPQAFDGLRIVVIADIHIGSFHGRNHQIERIVEIVNRQEPDLILFAGDLVNNFTAELDGFIEILSGLDSKYGKYSVLGNHDYGDYYQWESKEAKEDNMKDMIAAHEAIGFRLLLNEWDSLVINGEKIAVIGVENWGSPPFPQYGDLEKASEGTEDFPFRMLISHDPSHWEEVVNDGQIELTFSGHTHGFQFGIEIGNFAWSPSKFIYPHWGGLYKENDQYLYVNRGLGFLGFPGRVGMPPEITVIELRTSDRSLSSSH
jgi:uncharacterized protein